MLGELAPKLLRLVDELWADPVSARGHRGEQQEEDKHDCDSDADAGPPRERRAEAAKHGGNQHGQEDHQEGVG